MLCGFCFNPQDVLSPFLFFRLILKYMPMVKCKICANKFYTKPNTIEKGWGKYCSPRCQYQGRKNGQFVACFVCNKQIYRTPKNIRRSKSGKYFCDKSCQTIWRNSMVLIGRKHSNWKSGHFTYRTILRHSKKKEICALCKLKDKRILAVHHVDHNHKNNVLSNLIWLCHNCHFLTHHYFKEKEKLMEALV